MVMLKLEEQPPLIQAIFSGEVEDVRSLLDGKPDVNYQDAEKRSPLHAAAFKGDRELAELLLAQGARVNTKDSKWLTPLHRACGVGSEETVALLLHHNADTTARDRQWQTPLHIAAANNAVDCVSHLLPHVPNVNVTDRSGRTALHHAALNGHNDVVELLISRGCIVNACDKKDCRPIHWAAHLGHVDTMELLIRNGADINVKDRNQYTPLHVAASSGMLYACRLLLHAGAEVDAQNSYGNTPLHIACLNGHLPVCQELTQCKANLEAVNYRGQTVLHISAASTHGVACLTYLLEQKININRQSLDGRTALHMSAIHGRFTRSKILIDKGAIIDSQDKNGNTALHIAAQYGHDILTATLLDFGADPNKRGYEGRTPLHSCCLSGFVEVSRKFIQIHVNLNTTDDTGKTVVHCAAYKGSVECLDLLVSQGADFKLQDKFGRTPLHYSATQGHYTCVFTLVGIGAPVNVIDNEGCTPLHLAAAYDMEGRCVEYLLQHRADATLKDKRGYTPVHYAVNGCNSNALIYLLDAVGMNFTFQEKGKVVNTFQEEGMPLNTPLHLAARSGDLEILRAVISYFPDINIKNETGCTPLLIAAREGHTHCVQMLLRSGAKVSICEDAFNMSPVHHSAKNGHMHCLALLVDNTEDKSIIDKPDRFNRTALMLAISGSHRDCVLTLLKSNSNPNIGDTDKHSSLLRAVVTNQNDVVQLLISKGARVSDADINGKTVLHLAAACGHFTCLQTVLNHMTMDEAVQLDNQSFSALHWACYNGNYTCVEYLLQKGVFKKIEGNPFTPVHCATFVGSERCLELLYNNFGPEIVRLRDARHRSPIHIAALHGHMECARYLLEQGAEIESKDEIGRTALIAASQNGQSQILELLIAYKANLKSSDANGNTALHMACLKRHSHTARLLLEYISDVETINTTNNDRKTPLHLAARNGLVDVTSNLIKKGSSVLAVDSNGLTPALCCAPNACVAKCLAIILAHHPMQYPILNHSAKDGAAALLFATSCAKLKCLRTSCTQTELSLLREPRELIDELLHSIKPDCMKRVLRNRSRRPQHHHSSPCLHKHHVIQDASNIVLIEKYDKSDGFDPSSFRNVAGQGRELHRSFSEISLVRGEQARCIEPPVDKVIKPPGPVKSAARRLAEFIGGFEGFREMRSVYLAQYSPVPNAGAAKPSKGSSYQHPVEQTVAQKIASDVLKEIVNTSKSKTAIKDALNNEAKSKYEVNAHKKNNIDVNQSKEVIESQSSNNHIKKNASDAVINVVSSRNTNDSSAKIKPSETLSNDANSPDITSDVETTKLVNPSSFNETIFTSASERTSIASDGISEGNYNNNVQANAAEHRNDVCSSIASKARCTDDTCPLKFTNPENGFRNIPKCNPENFKDDVLRPSTSGAQDTFKVRPDPENRSLLNNRHVTNYEDVFKSILQNKLRVVMGGEAGITSHGDTAASSDVTLDGYEVTRHLKRKNCSCQYVCEKCITCNMFDAQEDGEEEEAVLQPLAMFEEELRYPMIPQEAPASTSTTTEYNTRDYSQLPPSIQNEGPAELEKKLTAAKLVAFLRDEGESPHSGAISKTGAYRKHSRDKEPEIIAGGSNVWPKVTVDCERIRVPSDLKHFDCEQQLDLSPVKITESETGNLKQVSSIQALCDNQNDDEKYDQNNEKHGRIVNDKYESFNNYTSTGQPDITAICKATARAMCGMQSEVSCESKSDETPCKKFVVVPKDKHEMNFLSLGAYCTEHENSEGHVSNSREHDNSELHGSNSTEHDNSEGHRSNSKEHDNSEGFKSNSREHENSEGHVSNSREHDNSEGHRSNSKEHDNSEGFKSNSREHDNSELHRSNSREHDNFKGHENISDGCEKNQRDYKDKCEHNTKYFDLQKHSETNCKIHSETELDDHINVKNSKEKSTTTVRSLAQHFEPYLEDKGSKNLVARCVMFMGKRSKYNFKKGSTNSLLETINPNNYLQDGSTKISLIANSASLYSLNGLQDTSSTENSCKISSLLEANRESVYSIDSAVSVEFVSSGESGFFEMDGASSTNPQTNPLNEENANSNEAMIQDNPKLNLLVSRENIKLYPSVEDKIKFNPANSTSQENLKPPVQGDTTLKLLTSANRILEENLKSANPPILINPFLAKHSSEVMRFFGMSPMDVAGTSENSAPTTQTIPQNSQSTPLLHNVITNLPIQVVKSLPIHVNSPQEPQVLQKPDGVKCEVVIHEPWEREQLNTIDSQKADLRHQNSERNYEGKINSEKQQKNDTDKGASFDENNSQDFQNKKDICKASEMKAQEKLLNSSPQNQDSLKPIKDGKKSEDQQNHTSSIETVITTLGLPARQSPSFERSLSLQGLPTTAQELKHHEDETIANLSVQNLVNEQDCNLHDLYKMDQQLSTPNPTCKSLELGKNLITLGNEDPQDFYKPICNDNQELSESETNGSPTRYSLSSSEEAGESLSFREDKDEAGLARKASAKAKPKGRRHDENKCAVS